MKLSLLLLWGVALVAVPGALAARGSYDPTWSSLDARPLPQWYDDAKFGIFIHWGVFSVPSYTCGSTAAEWYWWGLRGAKEACIVQFHNRTYGPNFKYADFAPQFKASLFDADQWAALFNRSGAKYVVLTSKHHDGFCNWPSAQSWNWNSEDTGPHQDNVGLITNAVRKVGLRMGLYHSLFEWFNPLYLKDKASQGKTQDYVNTILLPQLQDLVLTYKPEVVWSDGDWEMNDTYWRSREFLAWLYNDSPVKDEVVVNDRWGSGDTCKHGGYYTCSDRYNPGKLQTHKWENALTIDKRTWGYARNSYLDDFLSINELVYQLVSTVSCGGNMLLNVGPTPEGTITPIYQERLVQLGEWLGINGEGIYASKPFRAQNDTAAGTLWYTASKSQANQVYAIFLEWPRADAPLVLTQPKLALGVSKVSLLGVASASDLPWRYRGGDEGGIEVQLPTLASLPPLLQGQSGWTLRLTQAY
ncbi:Tissue alpha-L-fucosidase [Balamuthia mandrillaris]